MQNRNSFIMRAKKQYQSLLINLNLFCLINYRNLSLNNLKSTLLIFTIFNIAFINLTNIKAQIPEYISPSLKTVQLHRNDWVFSYPIFKLNSDQTLTLSFDEPGSGIKNYYYKITLCDADWQASALMTTEYITGIPSNPITDYDFSFNTTFDYIHYELTIPNSNINVTRSGNYLLTVYENESEETPVLIKRFMVTETAVTVLSSTLNTAQSSMREAYQEIDFTVEHKGFNINNPMAEISATIIQNGRTDNIIQGLKPLFVRDGELDFNYNREVIMEGGNEFRYADLRSTRFISDQVASIDFVDPFYHFTLLADRPRQQDSYHYQQDINGRYLVEVSEYDDDELQADYAFVHFSLRVERPQPSQKIYLNGALTNWQLNENSLMTYNAQHDVYEKTLVLKQGYYNYQYLVQEGDNSKGELFPIENSFQETENDYLILIYYKSINDRCARLIGTQSINTLRRENVQ